jgi:flagellar biogenesis protein FliO
MTRTLRLAPLALWFLFAPSATPAEEVAKPARAVLPGRDRGGSSSSANDSGGGWWMGPAGIAAALAAFGGVSLASRRFLPTADSGPIRVVGRTSLSGKHSACLLRVGDRVLIVGLGPQGPPSTLGEITDPAELVRLAPGRFVRPAPVEDSPEAKPSRPPMVARPVRLAASGSARPSAGFDRRIGDDE